MKKQIIIGSFLALTGMTRAQSTFPTGGGNVGINTLSPNDEMQIICAGTNAGITITQNGTSNSSLKLVNANTGGHRYDLCSTGTANGGAGNFSIYDWTDAFNGGPGDRLFIQGSTGEIGIGNVAPGSKLHVTHTSDTTSNHGIYSNLSTVGNVVCSSIFGICSGNGTGNLGGVTGLANGATLNSGGIFTGNGNGTGTTAYGVSATAFLGQYNYGIYASVAGSGGAGPDWAGYFNGDVFTTTGYYPSDKRLKKNIGSISNSLDIIKKLNPVNYNFDVEANPDLSLPAEKQYGFISQEIKEILPELTKIALNPAKFDKDGKELYPNKEILSLNYNAFIAILAKGIQEQQQLIESQNQKISALEEQVNKLSTGATGVNQTNTNMNGFELNQNIPNPFSNETTIDYSLPQQVKSASLAVYDLSGKQITSFPLEKNTASITITSEKLSAGIYIYSVVANGKILDSKRMVVAEKQ